MARYFDEEIEAKKVKKGDTVADPGTGLLLEVAGIERGERITLSFKHPTIKGFTAEPDRIMVVRRKRRPRKERQGDGNEQ